MEESLKLFLDEMLTWLPKLFGLLLVLLLFYSLAKVLRRLIRRATMRLQVDAHLSNVLARTGSISVALLGVVTALGTLGINVSALVAGLGLTGFALGFALKDSISNLLSGVLILLYQPFRLGDRINIAGFEGKVVAVDLRYTELDAAGSRILIPNSKLFTDPITVLGPQTGGEEPASEQEADQPEPPAEQS